MKTKTKDMTQGRTLPLILGFALPILAGNIFQQMYNMIDAFIVGRTLGPGALGAVNASSSVQFLVLGFCIGCMNGFAIPVATKFGAKDEKSMRRYVFHGLILTIIIAFVLTIITTVLTSNILHLLKTPEATYKNAYNYLFVIFCGLPFTLFYNLVSGWLRAIGDSKTPFMFLVVSTIINVGLDVLFIVVLSLGCLGAALATIIAQAISGILCFIYMIKKYKMLVAKKNERRFNKAFAFNLLGIGVPMGLQFSITAIGSMVMQGANNSLGKVYVDSFGAAVRIKQFAMSFFDALATGVATFVSQNYGANKLDRVKDGIKKGILSGIVLGILVGVVLIVFGKGLVGIFVSKEHTEIIKYGARYLGCLGLFYWGIGILNVTRLSVQSLGFTNLALISGTIEMIARILMSTLVVPHTKYWGICFTDQSAWISATFYIVPICIYCIRKIDNRNKIKKIVDRQNKEC